MHRFLRLLRKSFGVLVKSTGILFSCILIFLLTLFFREQKLPQFAIERLERIASSDGYALRIGSASVGFRRGLVLNGVSFHDLSRTNSLERPLMTARCVAFDFIRMRLVSDGFSYPRLPDFYYEPELALSDFERIEVDLPDLPEIAVTLNRSEILGLSTRSVTARVKVENQRVTASNLRINLSDSEPDNSIGGDLVLDFFAQKMRGNLSAFARYDQIAPVVEVLDEPVALPYIFATTEIGELIPARSTIDVDLISTDMKLLIAFQPPRCRYRGVPVGYADVALYVDTLNTRTNRNFRFTLDIPYAHDVRGRTVGGKLIVDDLDGPIRLRYNAKSALAMDDLISIVHELDRSFFDGLLCDTPPEITISGQNGISEADLDGNEMEGTIELEHGSIFGFKLSNAFSNFKLRRDVLDLRTKGKGKTGGSLQCNETLFLEGFDIDKAHFAVKGTYKDGSIEELADFFKFDLGDRKGVVNSTFSFTGGIQTNFIHTLNGSGKVTVTDGHLAQMKLFAGLTQSLSDRVPGISTMVNQSQASADFTVENGVLKTDNLFIEGGLVSLRASGTYDMANDELNFVVRVQLFKEESMIGKIIHPITSPITKTLLEFKLTGKLDEPDWNYMSLPEKLF